MKHNLPPPLVGWQVCRQKIEYWVDGSTSYLIDSLKLQKKLKDHLNTHQPK